MKIAIICGGTSTERDVSISSAKLVYKGLCQLKHQVALIDSFMGVEKLPGDVFEKQYDFVENNDSKYENVPDLQQLKNKRQQLFADINSDEYFGKNVLALCRMADIVFIALHGAEGENGKVQAVFEMNEIKYTGSDYSASLCAMDKIITKSIMNYWNIKTAKSMSFFNISDIDSTVESIIQNLGCNVVIKPACGGSSVGVTIATIKEEIYLGIKEALKYENKIIVEEYIKGKEVSVGIIDGVALPVIEIVPKTTTFYNYKAKYLSGMTDEICPARLSEEITDKLQKCAVEVYNILGLQVYARVDYIVTSEGECYMLEANTLPGMTPTSLLPQEAKVIDIDYNSLCDKILLLSLKKYEKR